MVLKHLEQSFNDGAMKYTGLFVILVIGIWIITGCGKNASTPAASSYPVKDKTRMDSIIVLDSMVNATKTSNNIQALAYSKMAMKIALKLNSEEALARACIIQGIAYNNHNNDSSFGFYSAALKIATRNNFGALKPGIFFYLAMIYRAASDSKMAVVFLDSSIFYAKKFQDYQILSYACNEMGNLKFDLEDTLDARIWYDSAYEIGKKALPGQMGIALASLSRFEKNNAKAEEMQKMAIAHLQKQPGNEEAIAIILINLALRSQNPDTAILYFQTAIKIAHGGNSTAAEIAGYNNLAYSFLDKKDFVNAERCLIDNAIPLAEKTKNYDWLATTYDSYADVLEAENKTGAALKYERKALKTRIMADKKQAGNQVRLLAALLDVRNKELRIQTNEKELQKKEYKIQLILFWFSLSFLILLVIILLVIWRLQRTKIKFQTNLLVTAKKLIELEENLKGRVAMELHDLTSPFYFTMLQQIENAHIHDSQIKQDLQTNVTGMASKIRSISHRMNSDFIGQLTLRELVEGLCEDLRGTTTVPIHCTIEHDDFNLSKEVKIHVYRIVQELLTNAIKYVTAGEVKLSLSEEVGMVFILYQDTGPGFDVQAVASKSLGLMNIFERAKIIHGKAVLNSNPGNGTQWNITIPNKRESKGFIEKTTP